ncbi:tetratricopeptide repeat protein [Rickettsia endosymbiont of Pantilius tunicatus]|uniref:tetratricopeptide repeat protein n=1 Tax=Rickettsia endosymbiont of Pantilius tunicatus TaxID=3066267 RepID=UPI0030DF7863
MKIKIIIFLTIISIISLPVIAKNNQENNNLILGKKYFHGFEVSKDYKKAYELFDAAGKEREPLGYLYMGYMHLVGLDVEHTHEKSNYYFELAAKQGLVEGEYQLAINKKSRINIIVVIRWGRIF